MVVFREGTDNAPAWSDVRNFDTFSLPLGGSLVLSRRDEREVILVSAGNLLFDDGFEQVVLREGQFVVVAGGIKSVTLSSTIRPAEIVRFGGNWKPGVYGCGLFEVSLQSRCQFVGDPVGYPKKTDFDSHYHDYDEYWLLLSGSGTVVVSDKQFPVRKGDCLAIEKWRHHDFPLVDQPVKVAYLEVGLRAPGRLGHLWNYLHGEPPVTPEPLK